VPEIVYMETGSGPQTDCSGLIGYCDFQCPAVPLPAWKRRMDVALASILIAAMSPVFLLLALYIKAVSRGSVLFRQQRVGFDGKPFTCFKFRTMHAEADSGVHRALTDSLMRGDRVMMKLDRKNDPRIIRGGRWIRKSALDETAQLFNVLLGEMSLVGPRPCIPYEFEKYCHCKRQRVCLTPGLTGLWQVSGKNRTTYDEMVQLDLLYSQKMSFLTDVGILLRTVPAVLSQVMEKAHRRRSDV
jgi:lipopolysaccharide/colanic/teichoic acid biosynthesis glycosyltransferase